MADIRSLNDAELAALLSKGDHAAYTQIYERYFGVLYVHARKKIRDVEEARDVVQETFVSLWRNKQNLDANKGLAPYLYTALKNKIIDFFARQEVSSRYINSFRDFKETGYCVTDYRIREAQLRALIEKEVAALPSRMREIFELSRKEHLSHREIAELLNISEHTVKTQVKHALRILKLKLGVLVYIFLLIRF
jgi:RNA polymerase sigma-70 factor (family 1)